jgi:hypothetical protein
MGRYDTCRMGNVFVSLPGILISIILLFSANLNILKCQTQFKSEDENAVKIRVSPKYQGGIKYHYKMTENTDVTRILSDSSVIKYNRTVEYYFSQFVMDPPQTDFVKISVSIDSILYKFNEGNGDVLYNSQDEAQKNVNHPDVAVITVPMGRTFELTYTPYGEIADISGKDLDELRDYVSNQGKKLLDTVDKFIWIDGISNEHLAHLTDVRKILLPPKMISPDSIWLSPFEIQIDGITFLDTLPVKVVKYSGGIFEMNSESKTLKNKNTRAKIYGINKFIQIDSCNGSGKYKIKVGPRGNLGYSSAIFNVELYSHLAKSYFKESITSKYEWTLINQN